MKAAAVSTASAIPSASPRFTRNEDGTETDHLLRVMWSPTLTKVRVNHAKADTLCAELTLGGYSDWVMPEVEQLFMLADRTRFNPAIDTDAFPDTKSGAYWARTPDASSPDFAWVVGFGSGYADYLRRGGSDAFVRAVRPLSPGQ